MSDTWTSGKRVPVSEETVSTQNQAAVLQRILEISRRMSETRDLEPLLDYVMAQALEFTAGEHGYLVLLGKDNTFDFRVTHGSPYEGDDSEAPVSHSIIKQVVAERKPVLLRDAYGDSRYQNALSVVRLRLRSVLCVPLMAQSEILGVLYIENRKLADAFDDSDIPLVMIFANQAATAIKNAQLNEQQNQLMSHLDATVKERTAELEKSRFEAEAGWAAALEENRLRTAMLSNITHDLRSPLNVVMNALEWMRMGEFGDVNENQVEWLGRSLNATQQVLRLVNDIFDLAKIEQGKLELYPAAVDVARVVKQAMAVAEGLKRNDAVALVLEAPSELPQVWADQDRVQQILVNLFSNAIKYTSEGSVTLRVKASPTVAALIFEVADTGIGIPKEDLSTIFDRYKKASNSNQAKHKGTGLGLAICKELVERQHGEIWVDSVVGEGTSFYFSLPLADSEYNEH